MMLHSTLKEFPKITGIVIKFEGIKLATNVSSPVVERNPSQISEEMLFFCV